MYRMIGAINQGNLIKSNVNFNEVYEHNTIDFKFIASSYVIILIVKLKIIKCRVSINYIFQLLIII